MKCMTCGAEITAEYLIPVEYVSSSSSKSRFNKIWFLILGLIIIVVLVITRPNKEQHAEKIKELTMGVVTNNISNEDEITQGLAMLFGPYIVNRFIDIGLQIDDYFIFNVGRIKFKDNNSPVTIGIFNNVFLLVESKQIQEAAQKSEKQ